MVRTKLKPGMEVERVDRSETRWFRIIVVDSITPWTRFGNNWEWQWMMGGTGTGVLCAWQDKRDRLNRWFPIVIPARNLRELRAEDSSETGRMEVSV